MVEQTIEQPVTKQKTPTASFDEARASRPNSRIIDIIRDLDRGSYKPPQMITSAIRMLSSDEHISAFIKEYTEMRYNEKYILSGCRNGFDAPAIAKGEILNVVNNDFNGQQSQEKWLEMLRRTT